MDNLFEQASRLKLKFETSKGLLPVEDIWDLQLDGKGLSLNEVAKNVNRKLKETEEESFVAKATKASSELRLRLDIVKHIIAVRQAEALAAVQAADARALKLKLLEIKAKKQDAAYANLSDEALDKMLAEL